MYSLRSGKIGMQVHAVPESERATDRNGRKLPWGYDYANVSTAENERVEPVEKGPFGRSMRRSRYGTSRSRSKTAEPRREEDKIRAENMAAEDAVFGSLRRTGTKDDADSGTGAGASGKNIGPIAQVEMDSDPTEVLLWGFGEEMQWSAIDFYERVSNGYILEDYDRQPPGARYDISRSLGRASAQKSLSRAAMRKKNKYAGGEHWIKITFDSKYAAELAIARQPHIIKGHLVYASPYQGYGPTRDEPILATQAGAQITSDALPLTFSTNALGDSPNGSNTLSSATATGTLDTGNTTKRLPWSTNNALTGSPTASSSTIPAISSQAVTVVSNAMRPSTTPDSQEVAHRPRIDGITYITPHSHVQAFAPKSPKQSWGAWLGAGEVIGSTIPKKVDGTFDWDSASLYWRIFAWLDHAFGTDFCGLKGDE